MQDKALSNGPRCDLHDRWTTRPNKFPIHSYQTSYLQLNAFFRGSGSPAV